MEQGKPVFCLPPADIFDNQYAGVVKYLREGAIPVFAPEDILQEYDHGCEQRLIEVSMQAVLEQQEQNQLQSSDSSEATAAVELPPKKPAKPKTQPSLPSIPEKQQSAPTVDRSVLETLDPLSKSIMELLLEQSPLHIDQMVLMLQEDAEEVAACLTELAIEQLVKRQPGQYYCVC